MPGDSAFFSYHYDPAMVSFWGCVIHFEGKRAMRDSSWEAERGETVSLDFQVDEKTTGCRGGGPLSGQPGYSGGFETSPDASDLPSKEVSRNRATLHGFLELVALVGKGELRDAAVRALGRIQAEKGGRGATERKREKEDPLPKRRGGNDGDSQGKGLENPSRESLEAILEDISRQGGEKAECLVSELRDRLGDLAVERLLFSCLRNARWRVRAGAAACLDVLGFPVQGMDLLYYWTAKGDWERCARAGKAALEPLLSLLHPDQEEQALVCAMAAAAEIGDSRVVGTLTLLSKSPRSSVRRAVAFALGKAGTRKAVDHLVELLGDQDPKVAEEAGKSLIKLGSISVEALTELLAEDDDALKKRAAEVLTVLGEERSVEPLLKQVLLSRLKDGDRITRNRIAAALAHASGKWAVDVLIEALFYYHVRDVARRALLRKGKESVDRLMGALKHRHIFVRREVALILGELGDPRAWDALREATRDRDWHVREAAKKALSQLEKRYSLIHGGEVVRVVKLGSVPSEESLNQRKDQACLSAARSESNVGPDKKGLPAAP